MLLTALKFVGPAARSFRGAGTGNILQGQTQSVLLDLEECGFGGGAVLFLVLVVPVVLKKFETAVVSAAKRTSEHDVADKICEGQRAAPSLCQQPEREDVAHRRRLLRQGGFRPRAQDSPGVQAGADTHASAPTEPAHPFAWAVLWTALWLGAVFVHLKALSSAPLAAGGGVACSSVLGSNLELERRGHELLQDEGSTRDTTPQARRVAIPSDKQPQSALVADAASEHFLQVFLACLSRLYARSFALALGLSRYVRRMTARFLLHMVALPLALLSVFLIGLCRLPLLLFEGFCLVY